VRLDSLSISILSSLASNRSLFPRWAIALLIFGMALGARLLLHSWIEPVKFVTFYPAVVTVTLICGPFQGAFVLALSVFAAWAFLFQTSGVDAENSRVSALLAFIFVNIFLIWIVAALRYTINELNQEIARRRLSEEQTRAAKAEADRTSIVKAKFFAAASHDLRQPAQSLTMLIAAIRNNPGDEFLVRRTAELMQRSLEGLNTLISGVLDVSRLDAGALVPKMAPVNLQSLLTRIAGEYQHAAGAKRLNLRLSAKVELWTTSDEMLIERIVRNLLESALRYTQDGSVLLRLREDDGLARIDVVDTGVGIPADKRQEVFEEFSQLQNPARDARQGLGLGLAIVARLAKLLGAEVAVSSKVGWGSRFSVFLPLGRNEAIREEAGTAEIHDAGGQVLIIEDNEFICAGYETMLRNWGYGVATARTGEEAIEMAAGAARIDAIIADHRLGPGLTGTAAATEINKRAEKSIPTLVITGDIAEERIAEVMRSGFRMLHKPVGSEELRRELAQLLKLSERRDPAPSTIHP
jgi:two-component system, sensor histidine kinase and response regulator